MPVMNSLLKIDLTDRQNVFLMCTFEPDKKLHVFLLDVNECKAFSGCAKDIDLRSQAATIGMTFKDFLSLTTKALCVNEFGDDKFLYCLEKNCEHFVFKWKSIDHEETIINIGCVKVNEIDYCSAISDVFSMLSKELLSLNTKMSNMERDLTNAEKEKENAIKLVTNVTDMKERLEKELYSKFILVLNEKKQKMRDLKRNNNDNDVRKRTKISRPVRPHQISDSSDEAESDMGKKIAAAGPSTSKHNSLFPFFDGDVDDKLLVVSPSKKRNRNQTAPPKNNHIQEHKQSTHYINESESEDELLLNL